MKDKLKAIWRILRAKSYFYVAKNNSKYEYDYDIHGVQPKKGLPAHVRVDIMFKELDRITNVSAMALRQINKHYHNPHFEDEEV